MNVLMVTAIFPPDAGGPATYVPLMAEALTTRGHQVTVLTLDDVSIHDDSRLFSFQVHRLPRQIFKPWRWFRTTLNIVQLGRRADVIYVNGLAMESALANLALRKPLVLKIVGDLAWERAVSNGWIGDDFEQFQQGRYGLKVELLKRLRSWWTRRAHRVIVPSQYLANWVCRWDVARSKIVVIYNAVEPACSVEPAQIPLETPLKTVTVGRLVPWKRVGGVLEAIASAEQIGLVVIGDGPERPHLESLAERLGITNKVFFAGQRTHHDTMQLMKACDLFVLNSSYEGFPHVVVEAMQIGLAVVATAAGGTPEIVQDGINGILMPLNDDDALLRALETLTDDPHLRRSLANQGHDSVQERFSLEATVDATEAVLCEVAGTSRVTLPATSPEKRGRLES